MKILKSLILLAILIALNAGAMGQEKVTIYDPSLDGMEQIKEAISQANKEEKHVLIQVGGNWCGWCVLFHKFSNEDAEVKQAIEDNYVVMKLNYSPENKNEKAMEYLESPGRFGYPVFVILDGSGKRIHTQNSGLLEEGKGYEKRAVMGFLTGWAPGAF
jgi:thioredoxin-related protein